MRISTSLMLVALGAGVIALGSADRALAQAGTTAMPPVSSQGASQATDAAKKAMDDERRRREEEAKKKAASGMQK